MKRRKNANAQVTGLTIMRLLCRACPLAKECNEFLWETFRKTDLGERKAFVQIIKTKMFNAKTEKIIMD